MKMNWVLTLGLVFTSLSAFCQCNFAVSEEIGGEVYLYTEPTDFIQESNENNKLEMSLGIEGYDNHMLVLELNFDQKVKTAIKEKVTFHFDEIKSLTLSEFHNQDKAFISNLSDEELNMLYENDIVKIDFAFKGVVHTFDLKSNDRAKHVDLIDCLDDKIDRMKGVKTPGDNTQVEKILKITESMPRFPGCEEGLENVRERDMCAQHKMLTYIYKNLKYPAEARKNKTEGEVVIQYVVDTDGIIQDAKIVRDIGDGCGEAALNVVNGMNDLPEPWIPGVQRGEKVKVLYTLPVKFNLNG